MFYYGCHMETSQGEFNFSKKKTVEVCNFPEMPEPDIEWDEFFCVRKEYSSYTITDARGNAKKIVNVLSLEVGRWIVDGKPKRVTVKRFKRNLDGKFLGNMGIKEGDFDEAFEMWMRVRGSYKEKLILKEDRHVGKPVEEDVRGL